MTRSGSPGAATGRGRLSRWLGGLALGLTTLVVGCGPTAVPGRQVTTQGNSLTYSAKPDKFSGSDRFVWSVTAPQAYVHLDGTSITEGSVRTTILDGDNHIVFDATLSPSAPPSNGPTRSGKEGDWQIRIDFEDATGTLGLQAQTSR